MPRTFLIVLACLLPAGCAGYRLTPVTPDKATEFREKGREGYIFYAPQPFLLGTLQPPPAAGKAPVYDYKIIYLPDETRPYRFTRYEFLAKADLKVSFADGWLFTGAESSTDSTTALTALLGAAQSALGAAAMPADTKPPEVVLYRIHVGSTVTLEQVATP